MKRSSDFPSTATAETEHARTEHTPPLHDHATITTAIRADLERRFAEMRGETLTLTQAIVIAEVVAKNVLIAVSASSGPMRPPVHHQTATPTSVGTPINLTERQHQVLSLIVEGCSNKEIAARLSISPRTAGDHVSAILAKLDVCSRAAVARAAIRCGLLAADRSTTEFPSSAAG